MNITKYFNFHNMNFNNIKRANKWITKIKDKDYKEYIILSNCKKEYFGTYIDLKYLPKIIKEYNLK